MDEVHTLPNGDPALHPSKNEFGQLRYIQLRHDLKVNLVGPQEINKKSRRGTKRGRQALNIVRDLIEVEGTWVK